MTPARNAVSPNVARAIQTLERVLTDIGWEPAPAEGIAGFTVDFGEPHLPVATALAAVSPREQFVLYLNFGFDAPSDRRDELARFVTQVNWTLMVGAFQLDLDDGQVRFRVGVDFTDAELTEAIVRNAVRDAMSAVETYANAVADVVARGKTAAEALAAVEIDEQ